MNDNPKLTAFVLGELADADALEIQTAIDADPQLQREVDEIRRTAAKIEAFLKEEPLPEIPLHLLSQVDKPQEAKKRRYVPTLIELLVAVSICGMLAALLIPAQYSARSSAVVQTTPTPPKEGNHSPPPEGGHFAQQNAGVVSSPVESKDEDKIMLMVTPRVLHEEEEENANIQFSQNKQLSREQQAIQKSMKSVAGKGAIKEMDGGGSMGGGMGGMRGMSGGMGMVGGMGMSGGMGTGDGMGGKPTPSRPEEPPMLYPSPDAWRVPSEKEHEVAHGKPTA